MKLSLAVLVLVAVIATGKAKVIQTVASYTSDVADRDEKGRIAITLDGSESYPNDTGCLLYEWKLYLKREKRWKVISREKTTTWYVVNDCKKYEFNLKVWARKTNYIEDEVTFKVPVKLDCNKDGDNGNNNGDEGNLGMPKHNPCKQDKPVAVADISKIIQRNDGGFTIKLDGSGSENCDDYIWTNANDPEWMGNGMKDIYRTPSGGMYEFSLECVRDCGQKLLTHSAIAKGYIQESDDNPCKSLEASFTVSNDNDKCEFVLNATESSGCKEYEWNAYHEDSGNVAIPGGQIVTYKPSGLAFGDFKFFFKCINENCVKKARSSASCTNPCLDKTAEADVSGTSNCRFALNASLSDGCQDFKWQVSHEGKKKKTISTKEEDVYEPDTHGEFKFFLTCTSAEGCVKRDRAIAECSDPNSDVEVKAAIIIDNVYTDDRGDTFTVELSGRDSENCEKYTWRRFKKGKGTWAKIGEGQDIVFTAYNDAPYDFQLTCENNQDGIIVSASTTHKTKCMGKLARKFKKD